MTTEPQGDVSSDEEPLPKLQWIEIESFADIAPGTRLHFHPGINLIVGKNATGKTTLLEVLSAVLRDDFGGLQELEFSIRYALLIDREEVEFRVTRSLVVVDAEESTSTSRIELLRNSKNSFTACLEGEKFGWRVVSSETKGVFDPFDPRLVSRRTALLLLLLFPDRPPPTGVVAMRVRRDRMERETRTDEGLESFNAVLDGLNGASLSFSSPSPSGWVGITYSTVNPMSADLLRLVLARVRQSSELDRSISIASEHVGIPPAVVTLLGFSRVEFEFGRPDIVVEGERKTLSFRRPALVGYRENGGRISHDRWSWGQRRLFHFAHYLASSPAYLLVDELSNGFHYEWIRYCIDAIGARQAFLTSQNPVLMDDLPFALDETLPSHFVLCSVESHDLGTRRTWRNMTPEEGAQFCTSMERGVLTTSELMRREGWW